MARLAVQRIELIAPGRLETGGIAHATGFVQVEREWLALRIDMPDGGFDHSMHDETCCGAGRSVSGQLHAVPSAKPLYVRQRTSQTRYFRNFGRVLETEVTSNLLRRRRHICAPVNAVPQQVDATPLYARQRTDADPYNRQSAASGSGTPVGPAPQQRCTMHDPTQPDPTYQPPKVTERRRPPEPGSFSEPGFQPKRRGDTDKSMPPQQSPGSLAGAPDGRHTLDAKHR